MIKAFIKPCLIAVLLVGASSGAIAQDRAPLAPTVTLDHPMFAPLRRIQTYNCANTTCSQIRSCDEACYKLTVCGHRQRDGDNDGIPCENLCSRRC